MRRVLSSLFITAGIISLLMSAALYWEQTNPYRLSFTSFSQTTAPHLTHTTTLPAAIAIPSQHISLPIIPAEKKNNFFETTSQGVSYLISSPLPGEKGNSILYGHNWSNLLGNLIHARQGDTISVTFQDKTQKTFTVHSIVVVSPDDVSVLKNTTDSRITIYTCTGFLDNKRFVAEALLNK